MPAPQLALSAIEIGINHLLLLDAQTPERLAKLKGKQLAVELKELGNTFVVAFSERIDLLLPEQPEPKEKSTEQPWDCKITLSVMSAKELQDPSRITQLIKQDKLDVQGDMQIAQDFSALVKELDIDWEEHLSQYMGDVVAHQIVKTGKHIHQGAKEQLSKLASIISQGALEEKKIAAPAIAVTHFTDQVHQTRADVERLQSRVDLIAAKLKD
jgi:ubiquinone biosynthesis protein UbiJ